jgi:uncharacterized protein YkwD
MARTAVGRGATALLIIVLTTSVLVLGGSPASAATARPAAESAMVNHINQARANAGLAPLRANLQMVRLGRQWSRRMAADNRVYHRTDLAAVVIGDFQRLADNVGYTALAGASDATLVSRLHKGFMASSGHRAQIMGDFNQVGVGIFRGSNGRMWVTVNFLKGPLDGFPLYRDSDRSSARRAIERLFRRGAIKGCTRDRFCTGATGSRSYLAALIDRATRTRSATYYVASLCGSSWSCRSTEVTRRQLAIMVAAALNLDPVRGSQFTDVSRADRGTINAIVRKGIMSGCRSDRFCPGRTVTRATIAAVVNRAIN